MSTNGCRNEPWRHSSAMMLIVVGAAWVSLGCSRSSSSGPAPSASSSAVATPSVPPRPAGAEELALVAPLVVGRSLAEFEVTEIWAVRKGVLDVVCRKDRSVVRLSIALRSEKGPEPPAVADKYAVFYSVRSGDPSEGERLAKALAEIVGKHADVPVPKGLTEFVPAPIPI